MKWFIQLSEHDTCTHSYTNTIIMCRFDV
jgi:hypothetical protein